MSRVHRFERHRFIGLRESMLVFDTDDAGQAARIADLVGEGGAMDRLEVSTFSPDTLAEARNRGFRPVPLPGAGHSAG
jgi:hypothetical protein